MQVTENVKQHFLADPENVKRTMKVFDNDNQVLTGTPWAHRGHTVATLWPHHGATLFAVYLHARKRTDETSPVMCPVM